MNRHWTEDERINHLYGVGPADGHLDTCEECRARIALMQERRSVMNASPEPGEFFLAAQRRKIHQRIDSDEPSRWSLHWTPAFAAAAMLLVGVAVYQRNPLTPDRDAADDSQIALGQGHFYTEIYTTAFAEAPRGLTPIDGMFEEVTQ